MYQMIEKENEKKIDFVVKRSNVLITTGNDLHCLISFLPVKTRFLYLFFFSTVKVVNVVNYYITNYIKRDLGNPNFSCTAILIQLFS